jgi:hypothetical protein
VLTLTTRPRVAHLRRRARRSELSEQTDNRLGGGHADGRRGQGGRPRRTTRVRGPRFARCERDARRESRTVELASLPLSGLPCRAAEPWNDGALPPLVRPETTPRPHRERVLRPRGLPVGCLGLRKGRGERRRRDLLGSCSAPGGRVRRPERRSSARSAPSPRTPFLTVLPRIDRDERRLQERRKYRRFTRLCGVLDEGSDSAPGSVWTGEPGGLGHWGERSPGSRSFRLQLIV